MSIEEQTYYQLNGASLLRPFLLFAQVAQRGYSTPLQRRVTDFGADIPFGKVNEKLHERYGIEISESAIRLITLSHANQIKIQLDAQLETVVASIAKACVISETDGSMVPIVETKTTLPGEKIDRRKNKTLFYKEAKLTLAHEKDSVTPTYSATMGNAETAVKHMLYCVKTAGADEKTKVHCVGDGALWIANRIEEQFGSNATYLIDFYHLCEYLSAAAPSCSPKNEKNWVDEQKRLLKENLSSQVLLNMQPNIEAQDIPDVDAPVRACHRYIKNRPHQLDYKTAIENDLPIGSGEIESAHRYIIQKRLKIAGAWWLEKSADKMLSLRSKRENKQWNEYWKRAA